MFGTTEKVRPEVAWLCNEDALNKWYAGMSDTVWETDNSKLTKVVKDPANPYAVIEVTLAANAKIQDKTPSGTSPVGAAKNELTGTVKYHLPLKDFQGPSLVTSHFEILTKDEGKNNVGSEELIEETFTLDIKHLRPVQ